MDRLERTVGVLTVLPFLLLAVSARKVKPVEVSLSPRFGAAGGTLTVTVRVEPDERNRLLQWVLEGESLSRRSDVQVRADDLPTRQVQIPHMPPGHYQAAAFLTRADASTVASAVAVACFSGAGISCAGED